MYWFYEWNSIGSSITFAKHCNQVWNCLNKFDHQIEITLIICSNFHDITLVWIWNEICLPLWMKIFRACVFCKFTCFLNQIAHAVFICKLSTRLQKKTTAQKLSKAKSFYALMDKLVQISTNIQQEYVQRKQTHRSRFFQEFVETEHKTAIHNCRFLASVSKLWWSTVYVPFFFVTLSKLCNHTTLLANKYNCIQTQTVTRYTFITIPDIQSNNDFDNQRVDAAKTILKHVPQSVCNLHFAAAFD